MNNPPHRLPAYELDLCIDDINRALGLGLAPGKAWLSSVIHAKTATKHAADYNTVMKFLGECCRAPTYIGQHKKHPDKVELILDAALPGETAHVLVAVVLASNPRGNYSIASAYCVNDDEVAQRLARGSVKQVSR